MEPRDVRFEMHSGRPRPGWQDLRLDECPAAALRALAARMRRGPSMPIRTAAAGARKDGPAMADPASPPVRAVFAGASGTGRTLAAEVVAGEAGLELFRIDISSILGTSIAQTEKTLGRLFEEAEQRSAIVLLEEGEALFGRRTEVRDAEHRYDEASFAALVDRLVHYPGPVLLTARRKTELAPGLARLFREVVEF